MSWLIPALVAVQVLTALGVILLVLLQHGKGADMGAAFGGGASGSLFGATGSANFLSRFTAVLAAVFFVSTLALAMFGDRRAEAPSSVMEAAPATPAAPAQRPADVPPADVPSTTAPSSDAGGGAATSTPSAAGGGVGANDVPK